MNVIDISEFFKLVIDYAVSKEASSNQSLPITDSGEIYFFPPVVERVNSQGTMETASMSENKHVRQLELALTEIFNYYARKFTEKPTDFEQMKGQLFVLGLRVYIAFIKDMQIPVDKTRIAEVWKKSSKNHQPHQYEEFRTSLEKLAVASMKYNVEKN